MVAVFSTLSGTFKNEFMGMKPTGKKITIPTARLSRFINGKEVESWVYSDPLTWYKQLGIAIPPG